ncbi:MAG: M23 family metallopeptidase [Minisyncoccia bacterium]
MKRFFLATIAATVLFPGIAFAAGTVKLPYAAGERFVVTTGYDTPPTHIKKDSYAIDFTQDGCDAYGKPAVASLSGTALVVEENGYNGGYGAQLLLLSGGSIVARYAHLIPGSIPFSAGDAIAQGTIIGEIGDTGLVMGTACGAHPGTHIHFAMDTENADGSFMAKDPEPISGYAGIAAGKWYVSDNVLGATKGNLAALIEIVNGLFGGTTVVVPPNPATAVAPSNASSSRAISQQSTLPAATSSSSVIRIPASVSPGFFLSSATLPGPFLSPSEANSDSSSTIKSTSSIIIAPSGGGAGPSGGVSSGSGAITTSGATGEASISSTDASDDSVSACE